MAEFEPFDPQAVYGVTEMPRPVESLQASLARHYPSELQALGATAFVLLSLDIDEHGQVQQAKAVRPLQLPGVHVEARLQDAATGEIRSGPKLDGSSHPALRTAAERAIREIRFHPAQLNGRAVPFWDLRFGVQVSPPTPAA